VNTNITTETCYTFGMGQDGKLYAGGDAGIQWLDDSGNWVDTSITTGIYFAFGMGQDNKLYAESNIDGIKRLVLF
jgi:hypothetical protein